MDALGPIDKNQLDEEWVEQPARMHQAARKLAKAQLMEEEAKANLKRTAAEVSNYIRSKPSSFGILKVTESSVEAAMILDKEYQEAQTHYIQAQYKVAVYKAAVDSLEHRKKALESLVYLFGADYYSLPSAKKAGHDSVAKYAEAKASKRKVRGIKPRKKDKDDE